MKTALPGCETRRIVVFAREGRAGATGNGNRGKGNRRLQLPLIYREGMSGAERKQRVQGALERVGMSHRMRHYPAQLSGGQQQRVAVARAIAGKPSVLLADEPTGNLDSVNGEAMMALLQELHREGATICMVTHDPRYAEHAQRTVQIFDGRVVGDAPVAKSVGMQVA